MLAKKNLLLSFLPKGLVRCEHILSLRNTSVKTTGFNNNYIHTRAYVCICICRNRCEPYQRS